MIFSWIFSTSKKIVDFRFPARLIDAVTCTEILHLRTPYFHYGRAPRPRALSRWNFACFSLLSSLFLSLFFSQRESDLHEREKHTDLPSFFRPRLPVKTMCSIDAYDENLKFWKPAKCEFWGVQNLTWRTDPRPLPCSCRHEQGRGCQFLQPAAAPSSVSKSTMAVGTCLLGPRATCGRASCVSLLKSSENEILRGGTPRLGRKKLGKPIFTANPPHPP